MLKLAKEENYPQACGTIQKLETELYFTFIFFNVFSEKSIELLDE